MTEETFPHNNWYIEITDENRDIVNSWKMKQKYSDDLTRNPHYKYVTHTGGGRGVWGLEGEVLITTEQFQKYILGKEATSSEQKYDYLIPIFKKA